MITKDDAISDISAFADDETQVYCDPYGFIVYTRNGEVKSCRVYEDDDGRSRVEIDGRTRSYKQFLSLDLARLDVMADRILQKRKPIRSFINGPCELETATGKREGRALDLLDEDCKVPLPFATRVVFLTADAGHGKTILLRQYQARQAEAFKNGQSSFLFWHVDLQGRQLLRLTEALMGDLGDLRMAGIWMPGILKLIRHGALVLAVDGFDELAAEQGSTDALGALATLVRDMDDKGVVVAASRRTFFDTEDYLKRSNMFRRHTANCEFDQIHLTEWSPADAIDFLTASSTPESTIVDPVETYESIVSALRGQKNHPILARPFLLAQFKQMLVRFNTTPAQLISDMDDPSRGVASIIQSFVRREVTEKWKSRETDEPYLSEDQHMELLADVAEEMWKNQTDRLSIDIIEVIATLLLDQWKVSDEKRRNIIEMVRMHALLTPPPDSVATTTGFLYRNFDHQEFRDYFFARSLAARLRDVSTGRPIEHVSNLLSIAQLPDSVARYAVELLNRSEPEISKLINDLATSVSSELRPTYLRENLGTLVPYLLASVEFTTCQTVDAPLVYSSLVFERGNLVNVTISGGTFVNSSFIGVRWKYVALVDCELNDVSWELGAVYDHVRIVDSTINSIRIFQNNEEISREYSPLRIMEALVTLGVEVISSTAELPLAEEQPETLPQKLVKRILRVFTRSTLLSDNIVRLKFPAHVKLVEETIIPIMEQHGVLQKDRFDGSGPPRDIWKLAASIESIQRADRGPGPENLVAFWEDIANIGDGR